MGTSEWIAVAATGVAILALVLGEYRAWTGRRARTERNIIDWDVQWIRRDALALTNKGPDEARDVLVKLSAEHRSAEVESRRMRKGDSVEIPVPHLSSLWDRAAQGEHSPGEIFVTTRIRYGGRITWRSPRGMQQIANLDSSVDAPSKRKYVEILPPQDAQ